MKKIVKIGIIFIMSSFLLMGCHMQHTWIAATCTEPRTCNECGKTKGESLGGHVWEDATCEEPQTCSRCGETKGESLGGHVWVDATCEEPRVCSRCGKTDEKALGHTWVEVTCTEPKTCIVCGETEGQSLGGHLWMDATCESPAICSRCGETEGEALGHNLDDYGKCDVCKEQIGITLTIWNADDYLELSAESTGSTFRGYPLFHFWLTAKKNVEYHITKCIFKANSCRSNMDFFEKLSYGNPIWVERFVSDGSRSISSMKFEEIIGYIIE